MHTQFVSSTAQSSSSDHAAPRPPTPAIIYPVLFRLPARGLDPYFACSRSAYYDLDRRGVLALVRMKKPGNERGAVFINFERARCYFEKVSA